MATSASPSDTTRFDIDLTRHMLQQGGARALLIGPERAADAVIRAWHADLGSPVLSMRAGERLTLPKSAETLLIRDVSTLDIVDQYRLLEWLNLSPPGISVIAVTSEPLFPLVQRGAFLPDLFYRLNLMVIDVNDHS